MLNNQFINEKYKLWIKKATDDLDLIEELKAMNEATIIDAFSQNMRFGTGGIRGIIGAGTNRINIYTVAKISQGVSSYIKSFKGGKHSIAISFDSRIKSQLFAKIAATVFASNNIHVYLYKELMPTPCLSFAVRFLECDAGVMITASHNPGRYNGYKVYGSDGCQITVRATQTIMEASERIDELEIDLHGYETYLYKGLIEYIEEKVYIAFIEKVKKQSVLSEFIDRNMIIVYTPLNGTGLKPVTDILYETGFKNLTIVAEQEQPDGRFLTCPYPNPEIHEALELGLSYCKRVNADLLLATDPDCDRCGVAVKSEYESYKLLSGNEIGILLLDFICSQRIKNKTMPAHPIFVKTIVTTDLAEQIANYYGVKTVNVLTGFKYIGEIIGDLERENRESDYICGFEESYGYLTGTYIRDKDGVNAAFMICEMMAYYKSHGSSLLKELQRIYKMFGYCLNTLHTFDFDTASGVIIMKQIMGKFRRDIKTIGTKKIVSVIDYNDGVDGLPKSDVIKLKLEGNCSVVVRPSGTEPKIKVYISIIGENYNVASVTERYIFNELTKFFI